LQNTHSSRLAAKYPQGKDRAQLLSEDLEHEANQARGAPLRAYKKFSNDWTVNLTVVVAYNLLTSFFPLVLAVLTLVAVIPAGLGTTSQVADQINSILPAEVRSNIKVQSLLTNLQHAGGILGIISIVGLLWGGSNLFGAIESAFAVIFRVKTRGFVRQKLMSLVMILLFVVLLPLSFVSTVLLSSTTTTLGKIMPGATSGPAGVIVGLAASLGAVFILFLSIYVVVPNLPVTWRNAWRGALIAAVLMSIINTLFPLYTAHFVNSKQYGAAAIGSAIITITWFWFFSLILLIGAQVNALAMGIGPWPYDLSRMLMEVKLPVQGGERTAMDAVRDEASAADKQSPLGVARDAQDVESPTGGTQPGGN
jgi:membrane protein